MLSGLGIVVLDAEDMVVRGELYDEVDSDGLLREENGGQRARKVESPSQLARHAHHLPSRTRRESIIAPVC